MQISSASLLAAQQARVQTPAQPPRAPQANPAGAAGFEPLFLASKTETPAPAPNAAGVQPQQATPFARPGSQIDIKV